MKYFQLLHFTHYFYISYLTDFQNKNTMKTAYNKQIKNKYNMFSVIFLLLIIAIVNGFKTLPLMSPQARFAKTLLAAEQNGSNSNSKSNNKNMDKAMSAAKECERNGLSPGAGLPTAEEQAEAAYADLIKTSVSQRGISLSDSDKSELAKGGRMWEEGSTSKNSGGLLQNMKNVVEALSGGAHISKNEYGET